MATLGDLRDALKTTLEANISGLRVHDTVPDKVTPPAVAVIPDGADFAVAMGRGVDLFRFRLVVVCSRGAPRAGQDTLDELLSGSGLRSIRQTIFEHRSLGLASTDATVAGWGEYGTVDIAGVAYLAAEMTVEVSTAGTS